MAEANLYSLRQDASPTSPPVWLSTPQASHIGRIGVMERAQHRLKQP
jgi:hypothetical protein